MKFKIYSFKEFKAILNIANGNIAYVADSFNTAEFDESSIPGFEKRTVLSFEKDDYFTYYLSFNISSSCNFRCRYCFRKAGIHEDISADFVKKKTTEFLDNAKHVRRLFLDLSGNGEPLLAYEKILSVADFCIEESKRRGFDVIPMFVCNGSLLTPPIVECLQKHQILFGVSLDGYKRIHNQNRIDINGKGTFSAVENNIKRINHKEYVGLSMTLTPSFNGSILKSYKKMLKLAPTVSIRFSRNFFQSQMFDIKKICKGYDETTQYLLKKLKKHDYEMLFAVLNGDDYFGKIFIRVFSGQRVDSPCEGLLARFTIGQDKVYPCSPSSEIDAFGVKSFSNSSSEFTSLKNNKEDCTKCSARFYCGGECPLVLKNRGTVDRSFCEIKKSMLRNSIEMSYFIHSDDKNYLNVSKFIMNKILRINGLVKK
jgi:uncharacterized protein